MPKSFLHYELSAFSLVGSSCDPPVWCNRTHKKRTSADWENRRGNPKRSWGAVISQAASPLLPALSPIKSFLRGWKSWNISESDMTPLENVSPLGSPDQSGTSRGLREHQRPRYPQCGGRSPLILRSSNENVPAPLKASTTNTLQRDVQSSRYVSFETSIRRHFLAMYVFLSRDLTLKVQSSLLFPQSQFSNIFPINHIIYP